MEYDNFFYYSTRMLMPDVEENVKEELSNLKSANSRFLYIHAMLSKYNMLASKLDTGFEYNRTDLSENLRQSGNEFFMAGMYKMAADVYTKCLAGSEPSTECYALAMANLSAAHLRMGNFRDCLRSVHYAMVANYPSGIAYKLYERAARAERKMGFIERAKESYAVCLTRLDEADMSAHDKRKYRAAVEIATAECEELLAVRRRTEETPIVEQLVGGRNENIPALSAFVEVKMTENMGRGVFATRDINPGKSHYG